jgi:alpha-amylase
VGETTSAGCAKWFADGDVHKYFSPYREPYGAFIAFMNVAQDLDQGVAGAEKGLAVA